MNDPLTLTPAERAWDDLQRFVNFERYWEQSAGCRDGHVPEPPERQRLTYALDAMADSELSDDTYGGL